MNALTTQPKYHPQLPAFLQNAALFESSNAAIAGISGGAPPSITVRASKWHLKFGNEEQHVNQGHLDVIVLDGNAHVSKTYYENPYNPNEEAPPPTCWSDNGIAPSTEAGSPQSPTCASCQWGAWGSKVTQTGSRTKACGDSKKLAVVLAADTPVVVNGAAGVAKAYEQVFLLRVPTMSMQNWKASAKSCIDKGIPVQGVIMRMTFDPEADYPLVMFSPAAFVQDEPTFLALMAKKDSSEVQTAIGANDQPRQAAPALAAPPAYMAPAAAQPEPSQTFAPPPPAPIPQPTQVPFPQPVPQQPAQAAPANVIPQEQPTQRRRGRPPAQEQAPAPVFAAVVPPQPAFAPPPAPAPLQAAPAQQNAVIQQPTPASSDLDALLAQALG